MLLNIFLRTVKLKTWIDTEFTLPSHFVKAAQNMILHSPYPAKMNMVRCIMQYFYLFLVIGQFHRKWNLFLCMQHVSRKQSFRKEKFAEVTLILSRTKRYTVFGILIVLS